VGAATGAKGNSYKALRGTPRLLLMEDPNELLLGAPRSSSYGAPRRVPREFLGELLERS